MRLFAALLLLPALGHAGGPRPGPLPAAAARVQAALPGLSPSSLLAPVPGDLGRLAPLPALDWGTPLSLEGRPLPAALDPRRAAVLLDLCRNKIRKAELEVTQIVQALDEGEEKEE